MKEKNKKIVYSKFQNARLEDEVQDWLKDERRKYKSWNLFFRELKRRFDEYKKD
jgi:hypothetical protein